MKFIRGSILLLCISTLLAAPLALASVGKVIIAKGEAYAVDATNVTRLLKRRSEVFEGDTLVTGDKSEIHIRFQDNAVLALRAQSQLKISEYHAAGNGSDEKVLMELLSGGFRTITGAFGKTDKEAYQIRTPNASIGIRGTNYEALIKGDNLLVGVYQGGVSLNNAAGSINLGLDSAFSFAQVGDSKTPIQGLIEAPAGLSTPLANSVSTTKTETSAKQKAESQETEETTAQLTQEDETLLAKPLFDGEKASLEPLFPPQISTAPNTLAAVNENPSSESNTNGLDDALLEDFDLNALSDARLSQQQIASLIAGAPVGIVVVNQDPKGYRIPVYTATYAYSVNDSGYYSNGPMSFDISLKTNDEALTYTINLENLDNNESIYQSVKNQLKVDLADTINGVKVPARVQVELVNGKLQFKGFTDLDGAEIIIDNFQGSDSVYVAETLGLCTTDCTGSYNLGAPSSGSYDHATHFGYVVEGAEGPVFVNFENERIDALANGYKAPDNVFIGNGDMQATQFTSLDADADGVDDVDWGYWLASEASPSKLLKDPESLSAAENITVPHFYATAVPASEAELVGQITMNTTVAWHATSTTTNDLLESATTSATLENQLHVNFSSGEAYGSLELKDSIDNWNWKVEHSGNVKGSQYSSEWGFGTLTVDTTVHDAVGHIDGVFIKADTGLGLVGGFGLQTTDDLHHTEGVFLVKQ